VYCWVGPKLPSPVSSLGWTPIGDCGSNPRAFPGSQTKPPFFLSLSTPIGMSRVYDRLIHHSRDLFGISLPHSLQALRAPCPPCTGLYRSSKILVELIIAAPANICGIFTKYFHELLTLILKTTAWSWWSSLH
jgi:hypothetical protein